MRVSIYVEGGGEGKDLRRRCRRGYSEFLQKAGLTGSMPSIIACGPRQTAYDDFVVAVRNAGSGEFVILLVDSEDPVESGSSPWLHLRNRPGDNWERPAEAEEENAHLMVQCLEAWFMADKSALSSFYGSGFNSNILPQAPQVDDIPKNDILDRLNRAAGRSQKAGYHKGSHSFDILATIDPEKVKASSPYAARFIQILHSKLRGANP